MMKIFLGTDHAGFLLKEAVKAHLVGRGYSVEDLGAMSEQSVDYPDFIIPAVERAVADGAMAVVFGGSGNGECIAANKVRGARAAVVYDEYTAKMSREHNNANVICLGGRTVTSDEALALRLVDVWLETDFSGDERHVRRLAKIADYENR
jgi:ribose 5-phosphate isomerase B